MEQLTFKKAEFDICTDGTNRETVSGYICGTYGIHKATGPRVHAGQPWRVYDLITGLRIEHLINTLKDAKALVSLLWTEVGPLQATGWGRGATTDKDQVLAVRDLVIERNTEWRNTK